MKYIFSLILMLVLAYSASANPGIEGINSLDGQGRRTGYWIINGSMKPTPGFSTEQIIEEGNYLANKKQGLWKRYYATGKLQSEITYKNNIPNGPYSTYYPTGILEERGDWSYNKNIGNFERYHPNGVKSQAFIFDNSGVRNGPQYYYHENGKTELEVAIVNGREEGIMKRYYANGDLKETKGFSGGKLNDGSIKAYTMVAKNVVLDEDNGVTEKHSLTSAEDKPNLALFKATGDNILYNKDRLISQKGYFKNGRLWNGRWYRYDSNGLLEQIEVYKNGKFLGLAPLEESEN
jgi:antitoxin component YwqK of YwqJK toxin-antitoxin module